MNRRSFLKGLSVLIGGVALEEAIPLGRVWSFPTTIKPLNIPLPLKYNTYLVGQQAIISKAMKEYADYCGLESLYHTTVYYDKTALTRFRFNYSVATA